MANSKAKAQPAPAAKRPAPKPVTTRRNPKARNAEPAKKPSKTLTVVSHNVSPARKARGDTVPATTQLIRGEYGLESVFEQEFEALSVKYEMIGGTRTLDKQPSGCLVLDAIHGGGFTSTGICILAGMEGSAKTTLLTQTTGEALMAGLNYVGMNDAENTLDNNYMEQSLGKSFDPMLLGRLKYADQNLIEPYFDFVRSIMRAMPDKVWNDDADSFVYRFARDSKQQMALFEKIAKGGVTADKALSDKQYLILPSDNTKPQAFLGLDSFPALITSKADDRESDEGGGMSERARILAEILPKIAGRFRRKGVVLLGVNQLREKPGVMYGSPIYEPMGNTLKFASAIRTWVSTRAVDSAPGTWAKDKENGALCVEDNPLGGRDYYSFKGITNVKNKAGQPFLKGWMRVWTGDPNGLGRGIDPVFDTWEYLRMTGQVTGARTGKKGFKVLLPKHRDLPPMTWMQFKMFILAEKFGGEYAKVLRENGFSKQPKLYAECRSQVTATNMAKPKSVELMAAARLAKAKSSSDDLSDD